MKGQADGSLRGALSCYAPGGVGGAGDALAVADFDGDGRPDIAVGAQNFEIIIFRNVGDGTFQRSFLWTGTSVNRVATADLNGDGKPDLIYHGFAQSSTIDVILHK
jgi:hypothetical protein